jgi:hypothetical protein
MRKAELPPRLFREGDRYYWKPERRLRPKWKSAALGSDPALAIAAAKRLNRAAAEWLLRAEPPARPKVRLGPQTVGQLVAAYRLSPDWRALRASTRETYS